MRQHHVLWICIVTIGILVTGYALQVAARFAEPFSDLPPPTAIMPPPTTIIPPATPIFAAATRVDVPEPSPPPPPPPPPPPQVSAVTNAFTPVTLPTSISSTAMPFYAGPYQVVQEDTTATILIKNLEQQHVATISSTAPPTAERIASLLNGVLSDTIRS
jgi:hypothetical protein